MTNAPEGPPRAPDRIETDERTALVSPTIWFGIMGAKVLGESFGAPQHLKAVLEASVEEWNLLLARPFRWSYDGKGLHGKAVKRFAIMLRSPTDVMELRSLWSGWYRRKLVPM